MRIYDISQELFTGDVYKGDPVPAAIPLRRIDKGDSYNLSSVSLCVHNGTHIDAPAHFLVGGKTIDQIDLSSCVGPCVVLSANGQIDADLLLPLLLRGAKRLLFKGKGWLTVNAAQTLAQAGVQLIGTESQTIGHKNHITEVHCTLLKKDVVVLEGIRLGDVPEGNYILVAAPLNLGGMEGAPCRAILIEYAFFGDE